MKTIALKASLLFCFFSLAAWAQVTPSASLVLPVGGTFDGGGLYTPDSVTLSLSGWADVGVSRTENTIWTPTGGYEILGDLSLDNHVYTPTAGPGIYWLQFRLIDNDSNFVDQWLSFTVQSGYLVPSASVAGNGGVFQLIQDGQASSGVAWTESVVWRPDGSPEALGNGPLGSISYTPSGGPGVYWYQFRIVDNNVNYKDQWIPFVNP